MQKKLFWFLATILSVCIVLWLSMFVILITDKEDIDTSEISKTEEGQIQTEEIKKVQPNTDYLVINETGYNEDGKTIYYYEYRYDENWNKFLYVMKIYLEGELLSSNVFGYEYYNGMISSSVTDDGKCRYYFTYDENKKMKTEMQENNGRPYWLSTYLNGRVVETTHYKSDNSVSRIHKYEYDEFFDVIKETMHVPYNPEKIQDTITHYDYFYNDNGLKSKCHKSNGEGLLYEYDYSGNIIKQIEYKDDGGVNCRREYGYIKKQEARDYIIDANKITKMNETNTIHNNQKKNNVGIEDTEKKETRGENDIISHVHSYSNVAYTNPNPINSGDTITLTGVIRKSYMDEYYIEGTTVTYVYHTDENGVKHKFTDNKVYFSASDNSRIQEYADQNVVVKGTASPQRHGILMITNISII